ncbi:MAG: hypothetical protein PWP10_3974 [Clostridiales bacterium]|jgi:hypothetical protein|nr:hypothetical protein [Clostridiales bacterium]
MISNTEPKQQEVKKPDQIKRVYFAYIWHGFFLALTMSMLDLNTVFPTLVSLLTSSRLVFGTLYAIMLGGPLIFNLIFSHFLSNASFKKKYLLIGIIMRSTAFLGMSVSTYIWGTKNPGLAAGLFFIWVIVFSVSAGFAGIAYSDLLGKTLSGQKRTQLLAAKQFFASTASFAGGLIITGILKPGLMSFPNNYALTLLIGFIGLLTASLGFLFVQEPPSKTSPNRDSLITYIRSVPHEVRSDGALLRFIIVENLASFSVMVLPFYIIYAREVFKLDSSYVGKYLLVQVFGTILSNLVWGYISRKSQAKTILRLCIATGAIIPLTALTLARTNAQAYSLVFFLLGFIVSGRHIGFEASLLDLAPDDKRTQYLGIRGTLNISIIILPIMGSLFIEFLGYEITFALVSLVMIYASWLSRNNSRCCRAD